MGKKVREYKSGDFIFAKVKGYPAWPARVQRPNGKKYFVYFYGTGETANLPPNMIFDYAENKDKFLNKSVKRRDFNDGVKQIEYDFANNVPLEEVIGVPVEAGAEAAADNTAEDSAIDATMEDSAMDVTANNTTAEDANATQNETAVEDSDDAGALVIDEGKTPAKGRKSKADGKPKDKDTPKTKEPKTPRGKVRKEDPKDKEDEKTADEELVSRSGRKIRPKRYIDEQTEDNTTLPSPASKRRRGASPPPEKEKADASKENAGKNEKSVTQFNVVKQSELEGLKEVFKPVDEDKDNILIAYLPSNAYAGIRLFQSRPRSFKNESARLQWDKQAARNALTLKMQLEREHISPLSVQGQLVMDLNLTDEEKAALDKERETEEKKSRVNFLKTEMKLIELDAKIKTCLCLEKAETDLCLKLLDELLALEVKPLMLLKHPTCLETVKRMRAYVGNTPSWDLNESDALAFSKQAHKIRKKADLLYKHMKEHFQTPDGLSFWEYFSERVLVFKKATAQLNAGELLELVHEPAEMSQPNKHSMKAAIDQANISVPPLPDNPVFDDEEDKSSKKKSSSAKSKKAQVVVSPSKSKRGRGRKEEDSNQSADAVVESEKVPEEAGTVPEQNGPEKEKGQYDGAEDASKETAPEPKSAPKDASGDAEMSNAEKESDSKENSTEIVGNEKDASPEESEKDKQSKTDDQPEDTDKPIENAKDADKSTEKTKDVEKPTEKTKNVDKPIEKTKSDEKTTEKTKDSDKITEKTKDADKSAEKSGKKGKKSKDDKSDSSERDDEAEKKEKKNSKDEKSSNDTPKNGKESGKEKRVKQDEKSEAKDDKSDEKDKTESGEPRAKRSRESKKTDPPSRSPAKRKSKF